MLEGINSPTADDAASPKNSAPTRQITPPHLLGRSSLPTCRQCSSPTRHHETSTRLEITHASRLRRKLDPEHCRYVVNAWGVG